MLPYFTVILYFGTLDAPCPLPLPNKSIASCLSVLSSRLFQAARRSCVFSLPPRQTFSCDLLVVFADLYQEGSTWQSHLNFFLEATYFEGTFL
jgi:hypothetical protein